MDDHSRETKKIKKKSKKKEKKNKFLRRNGKNSESTSECKIDHSRETKIKK